MKNLENEKKVIFFITIVWAIISLAGGIIFLKKFYSVGMMNQWCSVVDKWEQIAWAVIAYLLAVIAIYNIVRFAVKAVLYNDRERKIILYALPALILLLGAFLSDIAPVHMESYYLGDERNIWDAAVRLYPYFFVYTSELYLICFFILPVIIAPSIVKIFFCAGIIGYVIYRVKRYYASSLAFSLYLLCLLSTFGELGIRVHRMHWYAYVYLFFAVKIYFDSKEKQKLFSLETVCIMSFVISLLTVWRREGIYLVLVGAILLLLTYAGTKTTNKRIILIIFFLMEIMAYVPATTAGVEEKGTTYRAYLVHMLGERSLDRNKIEKELKIADKYMDLSRIDRYNADLGIDGFSDCMYDWSSWGDGSYYAIRSNPTISEDKFSEVVVRIIIKEPVVFLKSRLRAFAAAARGTGSKNLFIPLMVVIILTVYAIIKRDWILAILCMGVLVQTVITTLAMPASYFKYFYEMYLFAYYFMVSVLLDEYLNKYRGNHVREISTNI